MRILICQDMEGVAGAVKGGYGAPPSGEGDQSRHMMTREINAAVEGILDAQPGTEVYVWEAHPFYLEELHEEIKVMRGVNPVEAVQMPFNGLMFVGQHAMAGKQRAVLSHTGSSRSIQHVWVNDREFGEAGLVGALAGENEIPTIFLAGDVLRGQPLPVQAHDLAVALFVEAPVALHVDHARAVLANLVDERDEEEEEEGGRAGRGRKRRRRAGEAGMVSA